MEGLKSIKIIYSLLSVLLIIFGVFLLFNPGIPTNIFFKTLGFLMILFGSLKIVGYFSRDILQLAFQFDFAMGIISALLGVLMIVSTDRFVETFFMAIGLFMLADALLRIQTAIDAKKIGLNRWWLIFAISLITAIIGVILFLHPFETVKTVGIILGLNLIISGILNLYLVQSTVNTGRRKNNE